MRPQLITNIANAVLYFKIQRPQFALLHLPAPLLLTSVPLLPLLQIQLPLLLLLELLLLLLLLLLL